MADKHKLVNYTLNTLLINQEARKQQKMKQKQKKNKDNNKDKDKMLQ
jgi:hypothetical protein